MSIESFIEFGKAAEKAATALGDLSQALDVVSQTPCFTTPLWKENPSVMLSIKPQYCELIASGRKTIEVRKTKPKIETPFKCYIYETKGKTDTPFMDEDGHLDFHGRGQVIGEFICNRISTIIKRGINDNFDYCYESLNVFGNDDIGPEIREIEEACISKQELNAYGRNSHHLYGWHISDLVIYDKPKELKEFRSPCDSKCDGICEYGCIRIIKRPPQSWCYIEALEKT